MGAVSLGIYLASAMSKSDSLGLFNDAHTFLGNISDEVEAVKRLIARENEARSVEIDELRREQEAERFERRGALSELRYEFEDFVRRKIDKVIAEIADMKRLEKLGESTHQEQVDHVVGEFDRLKESLFCVQSSWGKLVSNCVTPKHQGIILNKQKAEEAAK